MDGDTVRQRIAVKIFQYESDHENIDWPEDKCIEGLAAIGEAHSGDCNKNPWTCQRCVAEDCYRLADAIMAVL